MVLSQQTVHVFCMNTYKSNRLVCQFILPRQLRVKAKDKNGGEVQGGGEEGVGGGEGCGFRRGHRFLRDFLHDDASVMHLSRNRQYYTWLYNKYRKM
jgi:hypothetical protein